MQSRAVRKLIKLGEPLAFSLQKRGCISTLQTFHSSNLLGSPLRPARRLRGGNPGVVELGEDCEFYPTGELQAVGTVLKALPGKLVFLVSVSCK